MKRLANRSFNSDRCDLFFSSKAFDTETEAITGRQVTFTVVSDSLMSIESDGWL